MANQRIEMRKIKRLFKLYTEGVSKRTISVQLGLSRNTAAAARLVSTLTLLLPLLEKALRQLKILPKRFGYSLYAFLQAFTRYVLLMDATGCRTQNAVYPAQ